MSAQKLSYGIILGANFYNDQSSNSDGEDEVFFDSGNDEFIVPNIGGYLEYQLSANIGVKLEATTNKKTFEKGIHHSSLGEIYVLRYLDINPNFKYDFRKEYRKGFYILAGPKFAILTKAKFQGRNVTSEFEKVALGLELGFGQRILKVLELETKIDYGLSPFFKITSSNNSKLFGVYFQLNVDLERIF